VEIIVYIHSIYIHSHCMQKKSSREKETVSSLSQMHELSRQWADGGHSKRTFKLMGLDDIKNSVLGVFDCLTVKSAFRNLRNFTGK
jgi:hypothetical protein